MLDDFYDDELVAELERRRNSMEISYQYQPSGGSPAHEREVFWFKPKNSKQREILQKFIDLMKNNGIKAGWTGINPGEMALIEFPSQ